MRNAVRLVLAIAGLIAWIPSGARAQAPATPAARAAAPERIAFPADPSVLDARRDLGAKGDGVADDTDALQKGLDAKDVRHGPARVGLVLEEPEVMPLTVHASGHLESDEDVAIGRS